MRFEEIKKPFIEFLTLAKNTSTEELQELRDRWYENANDLAKALPDTENLSLMLQGINILDEILRERKTKKTNNKTL